MIPDTLDILGKPYTVTVVDREEGDYGECKHSQCLLEVASYQCDHQKRDTLLHEAMHAVDLEMHCGMSEPQIRRMATGMLALLRQNRELVNFLMGD